jgi:hypothetical protein
MTSIFILLAVGGLSGFIIGKSSFSWPALIVAGAVLATFGAVVFQEQGFTALPGIFTIVACLIVNQIAYVLAIRMNDDQSGGAAQDLPEQRANGVPRDDGDDDVRHKDKKGQSLKFDRARLADY